MITSLDQDRVIGDWIREQIDLSRIDYSDLVADIIANNFEPQDIFSNDALEEWATDHGWIPE